MLRRIEATELLELIIKLRRYYDCHVLIGGPVSRLEASNLEVKVRWYACRFVGNEVLGLFLSSNIVD